MMSKYIYKVFTLLFIFMYANTVFAQEKIDPVENASGQFNAKNYKSALRSYSQLVKTDDKNPEYNFRLAICMLRTNVVKDSAYIYLEKYFNSEKANNEHYYDLGMAYHFALKFD